MILSALLFLLAAICYSLSQLKLFGKLKWMDDDKPYSFWGKKSDARKYKLGIGNTYYESPDNWYYRVFKIEHKEAFLGSATAFTFVTDSYHLLQFFFKLLFCSAFYPLTNWWFPVILWLLWGIVFTLCDKYLTK